MVMVAPMDTPIETADFLKLSQWVSPAFPVSSFAYSHGLEAEIAAGRVVCRQTAFEWITTVLTVGAGRNDAILLCIARNARIHIEDIIDTARALASSQERAEETETQGRALAEILATLGVGDGVARPYPVALGVACRVLTTLPNHIIVAFYLQAFANMLVSASVRFIPLTRGQGQGLLTALHPTITESAHTIPHMTLDDIGNAAFGADMAAMEHETLGVRIFRT
mgnify:FL=1